MKTKVTFVVYLPDNLTGKMKDNRKTFVFEDEFEMKETIKKFKEKYKKYYHYYFKNDIEK